ncbi:class IV adenylate cyclase [Lewinella sp. 4G2]|uniref:class IV adenylate cyclase n=1 Tax=Lewinella sp. 4G2 TaxID=1803372 RepID=UPI0007B485A8|nr:class IV adenylate cyclase [Lewinella sp. 4G2]OAV43576.1 adenylate cyclase [Lewinella sp. 4G2]
MKKHLVEIKATSTDHDRQRALLLDRQADFRGTDHQVDHYFNVPDGRLKLRHGTIEQSLIFYQRNNQAGPKDSHVNLTVLSGEAEAQQLAATLDAALGTWVKVDKHREIYFIDNVKFHLDTVVGLGTFIEIEAIGDDPSEHDALLAQCQHYVAYLGVGEADLIQNSYSDLLAV